MRVNALASASADGQDLGMRRRPAAGGVHESLREVQQRGNGRERLLAPAVTLFEQRELRAGVGAFPAQGDRVAGGS